MIKNIKHITGSKDKGAQETHVATEAPNTLQSKAIIRLIDVLGEGEIVGLVNGDKSVYLDETPLQSDSGSYNYSGITTVFRTGTPDQAIVNGFPSAASSVISVGSQLTFGNPVTKTINDSNVDHAQVILRIPSLQQIDNTNGDINPTTVEVLIKVNDIEVKTETFSGKCIAPYQRTIRISNLVDNYGAAPWTIKCERLTADSGSTYLQNDTYWDSYNTIIDQRLIYPDTAYVAATIDSQVYGTRVPTRAYFTDGLKIKVPSNRYYDSETDEVTYSGTWDGTFKTEWSDCPAWVMYDLLNNGRYGLGLNTSYIDKWELFTIGAYCDQIVTYDEDDVEYSERRFTFNGVIQTQEEAYHVINALAQAFRGMTYWATGLATFAQDRPKDATRLVTNANIEDGTFTYEGTGLKARHTAALVTYNNNDDLGRLATEVVENTDGISTYGWRQIDIHAFGCTSRSQARRFGKWILDSELNETEVVTYLAGWDHVDALPGEIIHIADQNYTVKRWGGRIVSGTIGQIIIDNPITFVGANTYSVELLTTSGSIMQEDLTNPGTTTDTIDINGTLPEAPAANSLFVITEANIEEPRPFRILSNREVDTHKYEIIALEYDANKFDRVEQNIIFESPPYSNIPAGILAPPTNLQGEEYMYLEGGANNHKFGVQLGWEASPDGRTQVYELQKASISGAWIVLGESQDTYFEDKPVTSGTYHYRVRGRYVAGKSSWATLDNFVVQGITDGIGDITGLQVKDGGTTWTGRDCEIEWDEYPVTSSGALKDYKIQVYTTGDILLRTAYTPIGQPYYEYTYEMNDFDNSGSPARSIKFKVYARDYYLQISQNPATQTMTNPAPDLSGGAPTLTAQFNQLKVDWTPIASADWDLNKYEVYLDTSNPPTTLQRTVPRNRTVDYINNLNPDLSYYCKIRPYDLFGVGTDSAVSTATSPDEIPGNYIDIQSAIQDDILITDSLATASGILRSLYDFDTISSGVEYPITGGTEWIEYDLPIGELINRIMVWADQDFRAYVKIVDADGTIHWYKGEADHTLDSNGALLEATNEADALTNYWDVTISGTAGNKAAALFPKRTVGKVCRLYIPLGDVNIRELIFERTVEAEQIYATSLSAITANIGNLINGTIQSNDWGTAQGTFMDLTDDGLIMMGGSDSPSFKWDGEAGLLTIDDSVYIGNVLGSNITGWAQTGDNTLIDGGKIWAGSSITLGGGGHIYSSDGSFYIDTSGPTTSIIVGEDGAVNSSGVIQSGKDYAIITDGDVKTYKWVNGAHREFKSLGKVEVGTASNGDTVNVGYFPIQPQIILSPNNLQCYTAAYTAQDQYFNLFADNIIQNGSGEWLFDVNAQLQLAASADTESVNVTSSSTSSDCDTRVTASGAITPANTDSVKFNVSLKSIHPDTTANTYYYRSMKWRGVVNSTPQSEKTTALGATIDWVNDNKTYTLAADTYGIEIQGCGQDTSGTFSTGSPGYEYDETDYTTTVNQNTSIISENHSGSDTDNDTLSYSVTMPSAPAGTGWEQYQIKYETETDTAWCGNVDPFATGLCQFQLSGLNDVHGTTLHNELSSNGHGDNYYYGVGVGYGGPSPSLENTNGDGDCTTISDTPETYTFSRTIVTAATDTSHQMRVITSCSNGYMKAYLKITSVKTTIYWRRLQQQDTTKTNQIRFNSYEYTLSSATILATGSVNYLAIG
jgi:hypothetical protein